MIFHIIRFVINFSIIKKINKNFSKFLNYNPLNKITLTFAIILIKGKLSFKS